MKHYVENNLYKYIYTLFEILFYSVLNLGVTEKE